MVVSDHGVDQEGELEDHQDRQQGSVLCRGELGRVKKKRMISLRSVQTHFIPQHFQTMLIIVRVTCAALSEIIVHQTTSNCRWLGIL